MSRCNRWCERGVLAIAALCLLVPPVFAQQATSQEEERKKFRERAFEQGNEEQERGAARRAMQKYQARAKETVDLLSQAEQAAADLSSRLQALLTSDEGKRLATDPAAVHALILIRDESPVSIDEVRAAKKNAEMIAAVATDMLSKPDVGLAPKAVAVDELEDLYRDARFQRKAVLADASKLAGSLEKAPKNIDVSGLPSLSTVIDESQAKYMQFISEAILHGKDLAKEPVQKILVDAAQFAELQKADARADRLKAESAAQAESVRLDTELRIKRIQDDEKARRLEAEIRAKDAEAERDRLKKETDAARIAANVKTDIKTGEVVSSAEHERKVALAKSPEVQGILKPFTTPGYHVRGQGNSYDRKPVSLTVLRSAGALDKTAEGIQKLLEFGVDNVDKERPRFGYPISWNALNQQQKDDLKKIQGYLIDLGDVMVELGMLAP
ncbi:MAG: hypothetical protein HY040_23965 [Planctomycetes bacterium]|nr:hypothetical protein [Planctomycetota bacterium]